MDVLNGNAPPYAIMIRFDPALNRALEFALGEKLVSFEPLSSGGLNVSLSDTGLNTAKELDKHKDCFAVEKAFLNEVGKVTETKIDSILNWEE